jgi:hypothetical protein
MPITKLARVYRNTQKIIKEQNTKYDSLYKGNKLIIIPRKIKDSINRRENKVSKFPMVMPLCGGEGQYTYIQT